MFKSLSLASLVRRRCGVPMIQMNNAQGSKP